MIDWLINSLWRLQKYMFCMKSIFINHGCLILAADQWRYIIDKYPLWMILLNITGLLSFFHALIREDILVINSSFFISYILFALIIWRRLFSITIVITTSLKLQNWISWLPSFTKPHVRRLFIKSQIVIYRNECIMGSIWIIDNSQIKLCKNIIIFIVNPNKNFFYIMPLWNTMQDY